MFSIISKWWLFYTNVFKVFIKSLLFACFSASAIRTVSLCGISDRNFRRSCLRSTRSSVICAPSVQTKRTWLAHWRWSCRMCGTAGRRRRRIQPSVRTSCWNWSRIFVRTLMYHPDRRRTRRPFTNCSPVYCIAPVTGVTHIWLNLKNVLSVTLWNAPHSCKITSSVPLPCPNLWEKKGNLVQPFCHMDINFLPLLGSVLSQTAVFLTVLSRLASLPVTTSFFIRVIL